MKSFRDIKGITDDIAQLIEMLESLVLAEQKDVVLGSVVLVNMNKMLRDIYDQLVLVRQFYATAFTYNNRYEGELQTSNQSLSRRYRVNLRNDEFENMDRVADILLCVNGLRTELILKMHDLCKSVDAIKNVKLR